MKAMPDTGRAGKLITVSILYRKLSKERPGSSGTAWSISCLQANSPEGSTHSPSTPPRREKAEFESRPSPGQRRLRSWQRLNTQCGNAIACTPQDPETEPVKSEALPYLGN